MALTPGTRLGVYEVVTQIGAGGMGEVYRATDSNLKRSVAIKVLPATVAGDVDRLVRFQREAEVLAALNHPNIGAIYGLEKTPDFTALVMELVEGDDLSQRIARGAIPIDEALPIAKQIADALEAAHEQGIIHRDLKPANIKVRPDGTVKVLDFGLAKAMEPTRSMSASVPMSPTITTPAMTQAGMILGTAAYMSPEQAKGSPADHRSDVFSYGCVVYEMLTGVQPFEGESVSEILASILRVEPDWTRLPAGATPRLRDLLRRCLEKDRKRRWQAIGDVRLELETAENPVAAGVAAPAPDRFGILWKLALAGVSVAAIALATSTVYLYRHVKPQPVVRFFVPPPENGSFDPTSTGSGGAVVPEISPDGRKLAFTARDSLGKTMLWVRSLDALSAQPLQGTDEAWLPFWSPDSQSLGFFAGGKLKRVDAIGGPIQTICDAPEGRGGTWNAEGTIVFAIRRGVGLYRVAAAGGQPGQITRPPQPSLGSHRIPSFLPDGRHFLYIAIPEGIYVGSLDGGEPKNLFRSDSGAIFSAGHLLFVRQGTLLSQTFNPNRLETIGDPVPVAEHIAYNPVGGALLGSTPVNAGASGLAAFSASESGVLVYRTGAAEAAEQLTWVDRAGVPIATVGPAGAYRGADVSPDGKRIAVHRHEGLGGDIWLLDERGRASRFTFDASQENSSPLWSRDGSRIVYASQRGSEIGLYQKAVNGASDEQLLLQARSRMVPDSWSPDGKYLLYAASDPKRANTAIFQLWVLPLQSDKKPFRLLNGSFAESDAQISPDGRWVAYASDESGRAEIYVRPFPTGTSKWPISSDGGSSPHWTDDGKELLYLGGPSRGTVVSVNINAAGDTLNPGARLDLFASGHALLSHTSPYALFSVSPDGKRFLIPRPLNTAENIAPLTVVLNWAAGLKK